MVFVGHWLRCRAVSSAVRRVRPARWMQMYNGRCTSVGALTTTHASTKRLGGTVEHPSTCPQDDPPLDCHAPRPSPRHPTDRRISRGLSRHATAAAAARRCHADLYRDDAICRLDRANCGTATRSRCRERFGPSRRFAGAARLD